MRYYSDELNKFFNTQEECENAEAKSKKEKALAEKKATKLKAERKARAEEVENAYKKAIEANNEYHKLLEDFLKDYNSFHMSYHQDNLDDIFTSIFKLF